MSVNGPPCSRWHVTTGNSPIRGEDFAIQLRLLPPGIPNGVSSASVTRGTSIANLLEHLAMENTIDAKGLLGEPPALEAAAPAHEMRTPHEPTTLLGN